MDYKKQGEDFLKKHHLELDIKQCVPQKAPRWAKNGDYGINYWVTLRNSDTGKTTGFDFWGSIADKEKIAHGAWRGTKPTAYDILTSIHPTSADTFEDFCADFGYEEDSREAEATYKECRALDTKIATVLTAQALEEINEIQ